MKKRIGVYVSDSVQNELSYFEQEYKVSPGYVLALAFKLIDKKEIQRILDLGKK